MGVGAIPSPFPRRGAAGAPWGSLVSEGGFYGKGEEGRDQASFTGRSSQL